MIYAYFAIGRQKEESFADGDHIVHMGKLQSGPEVNVIPIKKTKGSDFERFRHLNSHQSFEERTKLYSGPSTCVNGLASCIEGFLNASRGLSLNSEEMIESS